MRMSSIIESVYQLNSIHEISREQIEQLSRLAGSDVPDLISLANKIRIQYAPDLHVCTIMNTKSGLCSENCRYCAQSVHHSSEIETYPLVSVDNILKAAEQTVNNGVNHFGIVTSGLGYKKIDAEFTQILRAIDKIHEEFPELGVCASMGILSEETAQALAERNIVHYNHNIQVSPDQYSTLIADTHSVEDRINTIRYLKNAGIKVCSGGIIGLGETMEDRINLAYTLRELDVDVIPLNVLIPIEGTPLENQPPVPVMEIAKTFALFRLINPTKTIKFAAGRETRMKDFQGLLMLAGVNGFLTGGYLTTRGREVEQDKIFQKELEGFNV
ncbi:MAG: biotin synthase BioB [Calditrichia bacterium]